MKLIACKWTKIHISRERIVLFLQNEEGKEALGEISPYPSLNRETLNEVFDELKRFAPILLKTDWSKEKISTLHFFSTSLAFAIESALLQLLDPLPSFSCPFSALFYGTAKQILCQAKDAKTASAKMKLGDFALNESRDLIKRLKDQFHLRIDLNQKWADEKSIQFFSSFRSTDFDYIEDPLNDLEKLGRFPLPYALDFRNHFIDKPMKALVVKPSLVGTISKIQAFKQQIILSSCFDTGIGIYHIASAAKRMGLALPQGLGPYVHLKQDAIEERFSIQEGKIQLPEKITLQKQFYASLSDF